MSSLRLITKLTTSLLIACTLASVASVASAEAVRVPDAPATGAPAHFAQAPHQMRVRPPIDADLYPVPASVVDRDSVRAALAAARDRNLAAFHAYAAAGIYPSNVTSPNELNVWRDQDGHYCAAATVMRSTNPALAKRIGDANNNLRLATVDSGDVLSWILATGFTQQELVMIQKPFEPVVERPIAHPVAHVDVNAELRAAETRRLRTLYTRIEAKLGAERTKSLDAATDRLMQHPELAAQVVAAARSTARS